jgi:hypothetical protein
MQEGSLILVDCLGFRGIWNKVDPARLIDRLKSAETIAAARVLAILSQGQLSFGPLRTHLKFLSDTVALSIQYETPDSQRSPDERQLDLLVSVACQLAGTLAKLFVDGDIPLPLRGCISFGQHLCDGNFLVGPAVDEAAQYMDEPEGAFIWLLPKAAERHQRFIDRSFKLITNSPKDVLITGTRLAGERGVDGARRLADHAEFGTDPYFEAARTTFADVLKIPVVIPQYPMPIKDGGFLESDVINPLLGARTASEREKLIDQYDKFLRGDRLDIWKKRQNTLKFLKVANSEVDKFESLLESVDRHGFSKTGVQS